MLIAIIAIILSSIGFYGVYTLIQRDRKRQKELFLWIRKRDRLAKIRVYKHRLAELQADEYKAHYEYWLIYWQAEVDSIDEQLKEL